MIYLLFIYIYTSQKYWFDWTPAKRMIWTTKISMMNSAAVTDSNMCTQHMYRKKYIYIYLNVYMLFMVYILTPNLSTIIPFIVLDCSTDSYNKPRQLQDLVLRVLVVVTVLWAAQVIKDGYKDTDGWGLDGCGFLGVWHEKKSDQK